VLNRKRCGAVGKGERVRQGLSGLTLTFAPGRDLLEAVAALIFGLFFLECAKGLLYDGILNFLSRVGRHC
jgi:hypothetical protein